MTITGKIRYKVGPLGKCHMGFQLNNDKSALSEMNLSNFDIMLCQQFSIQNEQSFYIHAQFARNKDFDQNLMMSQNVTRDDDVKGQLNSE